MGAIPPILERKFSAATRRRGEEYFRRGAVSISAFSEEAVAGNVSGSRDYDVHLTMDHAGIVAFCSCPHSSEDLQYCKHLWALVLECSKHGLFDEFTPKYFELDFEDEVIFGDEEEEDVDDLEGTGFENWRAPFPQSLTDRSRYRPAPPKAPPEPDWKRRWHEFVQSAAPSESSAQHREMRVPWDLEYELDVETTRGSAEILILVTAMYSAKQRPPARLKKVHLSDQELLALPTMDRDLLMLCQRERYEYGWSYRGSDSRRDYSRLNLKMSLGPALMKMFAETGRLFARSEATTRTGPLIWEDGPPWRYRGRIEMHDDAFSLNGALEREGERLDDNARPLLLSCGLVLIGDRIAPLTAASDAVRSAMAIRRNRDLRIPAKHAEELLGEMASVELPDIEFPPELKIEEVDVVPVPVMRIAAGWDKRYSEGKITFDYDGRMVAPGTATPMVVGPRQRIRRAREKEAEAVELCRTLGAEFLDDGLRVRKDRVVPFACALAESGWRVEAEGKRYRRAGSLSMSVSSGIDWFDVEGALDFDGTATPLGDLAEALGKRERVITLADGSLGVVPTERIAREISLLGLATRAKGGHVRFSRVQLPILDMLLAARPEISADRKVAEARSKLRRFNGSPLTACRCADNEAERSLCATHAQPGEAFHGELRPYQREGLAWLRLLEELGLGGCLADDMGLGKTVQLLAHLAGRERGMPSLVVAPRSLVFNWKDEAARFVPSLRILDFSTPDRRRDLAAFDDCDVVVTTYGVVRSDASLLTQAAFDCVILDESQAIKNAATLTAKAVRLLTGRHRLALTGTPIENHIGELWSLMEFLNPGLLGSSAAFKRVATEKRLDDEQRQLVARLVRPLLLRRTKAEVAPELPERVEQTIWCELDQPQRMLYRALRDRYRASISKQIEKAGVAKSKIHVLEALLRLRQAACHPRLIDHTRKDTGTKFETLLPQLEEVMQEGHKVLVFSQFTELLALLREELDRRGKDYAYLDGQSRDRAEQVERFQTDPSLRIFLISLKAGGLGLNLTAADYVFLLDPWWNPAVEAQAIDRTHRIGQTRSVFAYRLVVRETVEEKILALQTQKRELVEAILGGSQGLVSQLTAEDVEMLLS